MAATLSAPFFPPPGSFDDASYCFRLQGSAYVRRRPFPRGERAATALLILFRPLILPTRDLSKMAFFAAAAISPCPSWSQTFAAESGKIGINQRGDDANGLGSRGQHPRLHRVVRIGPFRRLFPRRICGQVAVCSATRSHRLFSARRNSTHQTPARTRRCRTACAQSRLGGSFSSGLGHHAAKVFVHHVDDAADKIAVAVGKISVVALHQRVEGKIAVLAKGNFAEEEVAQGIGAQDLLDGLGAGSLCRATWTSCPGRRGAIRWPSPSAAAAIPAAIRKAGQ